MDNQQTGVIAALSQGNPGKALTLAEDETFRSAREILIRVCHRQALKMLDIYGTFADNRDRVEELFNILQLWIRDLLILKKQESGS